MNDEPRFSEEQVAAIFERATRIDSEAAALPDGTGSEDRQQRGLTLSEIRRIGSEVGISPDAIERSARATLLPADPVEVTRRAMGAPLGMAGSTVLPRALTDAEWAELVALLRHRFNAHGTLEDSGPLRSWRNGNLRFQLEPAAEGQRLRMQTYRASRAQLMSAAGVILLTGLILGVVSLLSGAGDAAAAFGLLVPMGGAFLGGSWISQFSWSRERLAQMDEVSQRALEMASRPRAELPEGGNGGESST